MFLALSPVGNAIRRANFKSNRPCECKWILERSSVGAILRLINEGKSREEAQLVVYRPSGKLGGEWDRRKTYSPGSATPLVGFNDVSQPTSSSSSTPVAAAPHASQPRIYRSGVPLEAGIPTQSSYRQPSSMIAWPADADVDGKQVIDAMRNMYDIRHSVGPTPSSETLAAISSWLAQDIWQGALGLPGRVSIPLCRMGCASC